MIIVIKHFFLREPRFGRLLPREIAIALEWSAARVCSEKRFELSQGLDTALYTNVPFM